MNRELIKSYKEFYYNDMVKYDFPFCTAFPLTKRYTDRSGENEPKALSLRNGESFIRKKLLHNIKHDILVRDENNRMKKGIPFYGSYVICKEEKDAHYHAHVVLNFQERYFDYVKYYIELLTSRDLKRLETKDDQVRMIKYMLRKGNLVIDSDNELLIPTGYNLNVNKDHFARYN